MDIEVIEDKKTRLAFKLKAEGNTFCNILKDELWNDEHVTVATYNIEHPLIGIPIFIVETDSKTSPRDALHDASQRIAEKADKLKKEFKKNIK